METTSTTAPSLPAASQSLVATSNNATASKDTPQSQPVSILTRLPLPPPPPTEALGEGGVGFDLNTLLMSGEVVLVSDDFQSLELPPPLRSCFWEGKKGEGSVCPPPPPPEILHQLENDLKW